MNPDNRKNKHSLRSILIRLLHGPQGGIILSIALMAVAATVSLKTCSTPASGNGYDDSPASGDTLNVAIDYSPMSLYRYGDTLAGFNYEMMKEMAAIYGDKIKFHPVASIGQALDELSHGRYDILIADIPVTSSRRDSFRFTEPVYLDRQVLISLDTTLHSQLDLAGREVWAVPSTPSAERIRNLSREIGDTIILRHDSIHSAEQLFMLTAMGRIPLAVINEAKASKLAADYPQVDISTPVSFTQFQSWVVNPRRKALADSLDARIRRFKATPQYARLVERYLNRQP